MLGGLPVLYEFAEEASDHLGFELDLDELLSIVDCDGLSDKCGEDGEVPAVGPDDLIALTAIGTTDETRPAGAFGSTHFSASKRRGEGDDIHHITIRDVHGYSAGNCQIVRLLNTRGVKLHDILIERVHDCSARALHNRAVLRIGDRNPHWGGPNPIGDTARIIARGIVSNAQAAIVIQGSLADSTIEDVRLRRNKLGLVELLNQEYLRDVRLPQVP